MLVPWHARRCPARTRPDSAEEACSREARKPTTSGEAARHARRPIAAGRQQPPPRNSARGTSFPPSPASARPSPAPVFPLSGGRHAADLLTLPSIRSAAARQRSAVGSVAGGVAPGARLRGLLRCSSAEARGCERRTWLALERWATSSQSLPATRATACCPAAWRCPPRRQTARWRSRRPRRAESDRLPPPHSVPHSTANGACATSRTSRTSQRW